MVEFRLQNYNEFRNWISWHDFISLIVNEFPILLVRRYLWLDSGNKTWLIAVLGFTFTVVVPFKETKKEE